jgi:hypothetical protein
MLSKFLSLIETGQLTEVERIKLQPKSERREAVPQAFQQGLVGRWLSTSLELRGGIPIRHRPEIADRFNRIR